MKHELRSLPYDLDALQPHISRETLEFHYGKHHRTYVTKLNELIRGGPFENATLEDIIRRAEGPLFNNAAQVWNHDFFWESLAPNGGGTPPEPIQKRIDASFGSFANFRDKFVEQAVAQFGSGWAWLVVKDGKLDIMTTSNADCPMTHGIHALWTCDVWEHAYYLDYQNERPRFVKSVIESIANWQFVSKRLTEADR